MKSWKDAIDAAAKLCGGQNALARRLEITSGWISAARAGKKAIPKEKLEVLSQLLEEDPAELWELQEVANLPRRNPFLHAAGAVLSAFLCVVLSLAQNDANAATMRASDRYTPFTPIHIVELSPMSSG